MIYNTEFSCPDGHAFKANAKLRARCPQCGKMSRRAFTTKEEPVGDNSALATGGESTPVPEPPVAPTRKVELIRRGKPKIMVKRTAPPKGKDGKFLSSKKRSSITTGKSTNSGLVKKHTVVSKGKKPVMPKVTGKPPRTAVARHVSGGDNKNVSYADRMMNDYGFRR